MPIHNPSSSLSSECRKAAKVLDSFVNLKGFPVDKTIPRKVLAQAKGLAIITVAKVGMMSSARLGSGLVVARLPNGSWSAPSAVTTGGLGIGGQFGTESTEFVFVLNTDAAVETFSRSGSFTLGGNVSIAAGPLGRNADAALQTRRNTAAIFAYSKTRTSFGGLTLEGAMIGERADANRKLYHRNLTARQLLRGEVAPLPETIPLLQILTSELFRPAPSSSLSSPISLASLAPPLPPPPPPPPPPDHRRGQSRVRALQIPSFELHPPSPQDPKPPLLELSAQNTRPTPELDAGRQQSVFELPAVHPRDGVHELHSVELASPPPPPPPVPAKTRRPKRIDRRLPPSPPPSEPGSPQKSPSTPPGKPSSLERRSRVPTLLASGQGTPPSAASSEQHKPQSPKRLSRIPTILSIGRSSSDYTSKPRWSRHDPLPF